MTKVEGAKRVAAGFAAAGGAMAAAEAFESRLLNAARPPQAVERDGASVELGLWP